MKPKIIPAAAATSAAPVEIAISVTRFVDVLAAGVLRTGRGTAYSMKLRKKDPRVFIKGDDIYVAPPGATLRFTLLSPAGDRTTYFPIGIAFVREGDNTSDAQRLGLLNFPQDQVRLEGRSLSIADTYQDDKGTVRYKFSVVVQRGSDGKLGIIDPGIVHETDH